MKLTSTFLILSFVLTCTNIKAQTTSIPDAAFEQELIDLEIDSDGIVNGQMATVDAQAITTLTIHPDDIPNPFIYDLTGIEAFINLEQLAVHLTMIEELNVSTMPNLKRIDCHTNMLTYIDVSNNPLLEYLDISSGGDVYPFNSFSEIDLSNNPNFKELRATNAVVYINLKNGNNNPDMLLDIGQFTIWGPGPEYNVCIEVDDAIAAQNNQEPYSQWTIHHSYTTYSFAETCTAGTESFEKNSISVYPNPASDVVYISLKNGDLPDKAVIYDLSGREVKNYGAITSGSISLEGISKGIYLLTVSVGKQTETKKLIVN